jgi:transketolase
VTTPETPYKFGVANIIRFRREAPRFIDAFEQVLSTEYTNEGEQLAIIACGPMVPEAMRSAWILKNEYGIETRVINAHTVKPIDEQAILAAANEIGIIVTAEEHQVGGFGNIVAGIAARRTDHSKPLKIAQIGVQDTFGESGAPWELMKLFGLTAENIAKKALELLK